MYRRISLAQELVSGAPAKPLFESPFFRNKHCSLPGALFQSANSTGSGRRSSLLQAGLLGAVGKASKPQMMREGGNWEDRTDKREERNEGEGR